MSKNFKGLLLSSVVMAAILPMLIAGVLSPEELRLSSKADSNTPLRLWFEPGNIRAKPGQTIKLKVMAAYDETAKIIPNLEFRLNGSEMVEINKPDISFNQGFNGRTEIGQIEVIVQGEGTSLVGVDSGSVNSGLPDLPVVTTDANIITRE